MRYKVLKILGCFYITIGLVCNQWVIAWLFAPDGRITEANSKIIIGLFEVLMIVLGAITLKKNKTEFAVNLNLLVWTLAVITPLLGEMTFRAGIALNIKQFREPALYADYFSDDDYWKFRWDWKENYGDTLLPLKRLHPLLGWTQANLTEDNPLGLQEDVT